MISKTWEGLTKVTLLYAGEPKGYKLAYFGNGAKRPARPGLK